MAVTIQFRRDTKANWEKYNPVLAPGELGVEIDTWRFKIGDGIRKWTELPYSSKTLRDNPEEVLQLVDVVSVTYNESGQPTEILYANGSKRIFTYNDLGLLVKDEITDTDGATVLEEITYTYDSENRLQSIQRRFF